MIFTLLVSDLFAAFLHSFWKCNISRFIIINTDQHCTFCSFKQVSVSSGKIHTYIYPSSNFTQNLWGASLFPHLQEGGHYINHLSLSISFFPSSTLPQRNCLLSKASVTYRRAGTGTTHKHKAILKNSIFTRCALLKLISAPETWTADSPTSPLSVPLCIRYAIFLLLVKWVDTVWCKWLFIISWLLCTTTGYETRHCLCPRASFV